MCQFHAQRHREDEDRQDPQVASDAGPEPPRRFRDDQADSCAPSEGRGSPPTPRARMLSTWSPSVAGSTDSMSHLTAAKLIDFIVAQRKVNARPNSINRRPTATDSFCRLHRRGFGAWCRHRCAQAMLPGPRPGPVARRGISEYLPLALSLSSA